MCGEARRGEARQKDDVAGYDGRLGYTGVGGGGGSNSLGRTRGVASWGL